MCGTWDPTILFSVRGLDTVFHRFLRGRCPVNNCPFSHTIDPSKMPVCSHFLQAACSREDCPYRHVKVNPSAPVCLGFVRGHCEAGEEVSTTIVCLILQYCCKGFFRGSMTLNCHLGCHFFIKQPINQWEHILWGVSFQPLINTQRDHF